MPTARNLFTFLAWTGIIALSVYFFIGHVFVYFTGFRSKIFGDSFFSNQFWVVCHLAGGTVTLFLGPVQFWKGIRERYLSFHRLTGKIYLFAALLTGVSALRLSLISSCRPCRVSLFILAVLLLFTTAAAWYAVKKGNLKAHRQFMIRSYVTILSFVAVRIDAIFPMAFLFGDLENATFNRTVNEYFFSFVPLLVTEIFLTWLPPLRNLKKLPVRQKKAVARPEIDQDS